ncbi:MAG: 16S rRNA (cytosine(1402)-N(4))-methyltransferase [Oscillospiraceae bacterium]|nr:MAG: 16S rRNA (cytosine(1402)-N(4))-methyltransferase [Oscillospiraceae bacterium]
MIGILQLAKDRLAETANPEGVYVDFTMGKGRDTLFLASLAPRGKVYAFDIQPEARDATAALLAQHGVTNATLILDSHARFSEYVTEPIDGGLFNLGFLPGGDRTLTTRRSSTIPAVLGALEALKIGGALGVAVYPGHEEGRLEGEELIRRLSDIPKERFDIFLYKLLNVPESPYLIVAERRGR